MVALLTEDVTWSMPPRPHWYRGLAAVIDFAVRRPADRLRQLAARPDQRERAAGGRRVPRAADGGSILAWSINVLTVRGDRIARVTSFLGPEHFALLGLPAEVS